MKTLIVLRHADAAGKSGGMSDFERPLSEEGRRQAGGQGAFLRQAGISMERVVASSALRAMETAEAVMGACNSGIEVESAQELYNAPAEDLLDYVRGLPNEFASLLLIAHLPGVAQLLSLLTTEHVDLDLIYSPGTLAAVQFEAKSWQEVDYGTGALILFLPPILPLA